MPMTLHDYVAAVRREWAPKTRTKLRAYLYRNVKGEFCKFISKPTMSGTWNYVGMMDWLGNFTPSDECVSEWEYGCKEP